MTGNDPNGAYAVEQISNCIWESHYSKYVEIGAYTEDTCSTQYSWGPDPHMTSPYGSFFVQVKLHAGPSGYSDRFVTVHAHYYDGDPSTPFNTFESESGRIESARQVPINCVEGSHSNYITADTITCWYFNGGTATVEEL